MHVQTLRTARLTTRPPPIGQPFRENISPFIKYDLNPPRKRVIAKGILRRRVINQPMPEPPPPLADPKTSELLAKFFASQGIPLNNANDYAFKDLMRYICPEKIIPTEEDLGKAMEKQASNRKLLIKYKRTTGAISVTVDVITRNEVKYMAFSIHFFEDIGVRKCMTFLRKQLVGENDTDSILNTIRRAVNPQYYTDVKFTNIVGSNEEIFNLVSRSDAIKRHYMCFQQVLCGFVADVLEIDEFALGMGQLREFVRFVKRDADCYSKFRRMQLTKNADMDLPVIDEGPWTNTVFFLTKCLLMHDTFSEYSDRHHYNDYISKETFCFLIYCHKVLVQCMKQSREMGGEYSSISQVIPVHRGIAHFLSTNRSGYRFEKQIRESLDANFMPLLNGKMKNRFIIATYLDPRYTYRDSIGSHDEFKAMGNVLVSAFVNYDASMVNLFPREMGMLDRKDREQMISLELKTYRKMSFVAPPEDGGSQFQWWADRKSRMKILSVIARDFLACPAVAVDSAHFFTNGGKFEHICQKYKMKRLEPILSVAGHQQTFRGRGFTDTIVPQATMETLKAINQRIMKAVQYEKYQNNYVVTQQERDEMRGLHYYPRNMPTNRYRPDLITAAQEPRPVGIQQMTIIGGPLQRRPPPGKTFIVDGRELKLLPNKIPIRQVPLQARPPPPTAQHPIMNGVLPKNEIEKKPDVTPDAPAEEQKPSLIPEKEIKEEVVEPEVEKVIKDEPLDDYEAPVPPVPQEDVKPDLDALNNTPVVQTPTPTPPATMTHIHNTNVKYIRPVGRAPQTIKPHNFVQKFAGQQRFVPKFPPKKIPLVMPPPISIRDPIPPSLRRPSLLFEERKPEKLDSTNVVKAVQEDVKMEPVDDYVKTEPVVEDVKKEPVEDETAKGNYDMFKDAPGKAYRKALNQVSMQHAIERHHSHIEMRRRRACNRRCAVCGLMEHHESLKNVTIDNEKLLLMLGSIYRGELHVHQAQAFLSRDTKTYICRKHFATTLEEIYKMLRLSPNAEVLECSAETIQNIMVTVSILKSHITPQQLRKSLYDFVERNRHLRYRSFMRPRTGGSFYADVELANRFRNDIDEHTIIPKEHRQPRKQILEADQHDSTVKVIEQDRFRLPTVKPPDDETCDNPGVCCFCSKRGDRALMLKIPRGEDRLSRWVEKLGPEFEMRLKGESEHLICRSHFPEEAFSCRGRLLKGMIPVGNVEKIETTYRIQGDNFLKLREKKSASSKEPTVNLTTEGCDMTDLDILGKEEAEAARQLRLKRRSGAIKHDYYVPPKKGFQKRKYKKKSKSPDDEDLLASDDAEYFPGQAEGAKPSRKRGRPKRFDLLDEYYMEEEEHDEQVAEKVMEEVPKKVLKMAEGLEQAPKQEPEQALEKTPKQEPEQALEKVPKQETEQAPEKVPKQEPEQAPMKEPKQEPEEAPEQAKEKTPEESKDIPTASQISTRRQSTRLASAERDVSVQEKAEALKRSRYEMPVSKRVAKKK